MWIAFAIFQLFALGGLALFLSDWTGRSTSWVEKRGWGWPCFAVGILFTFFQGLALSILAFEIFDSAALELLTLFVMFIMNPVFLWCSLLWTPRFMLPGWIRERLRAGDPVKTAEPLPEVQHLMTKRPNLKQKPEPDEEPPAWTPQGAAVEPLPITYKISMLFFWVFSILLGCLALFWTLVLLGVFGNAPTVWLPRGVSSPTAQALFCGFLAFTGVHYALRHRHHITLSHEGVATERCQVLWSEIAGVTVLGDPDAKRSDIVLHLTDEGHTRLLTFVDLGGRSITMRPCGRHSPREIAEQIEAHRLLKASRSGTRNRLSGTAGSGSHALEAPQPQ